MIIGKIDQYLYEARQRRLERLYKQDKRVFLWCPRKLIDGRIAWLEWAEKDHMVIEHITLKGEVIYFIPPFGKVIYRAIDKEKQECTN